eukprot:CAMPEP_0181290058 /NCGR_PEP_ID=MMETSP1101-20121128/1216_1 /TAXON_ID=46948 /ORGANISM="Rhodomonas abbreviata, Strain Caron Lab Isolate" /LENGTH=106 /DNA_ID=CAMNT_0023394327 /DNA_START=8 /DNA_END=328 /DNA_ORIENTATION=-
MTFHYFGFCPALLESSKSSGVCTRDIHSLEIYPPVSRSSKDSTGHVPVLNPRNGEDSSNSAARSSGESEDTCRLFGVSGSTSSEYSSGTGEADARWLEFGSICNCN